MDEHFSQMLAPRGGSTKRQAFIPSTVFTGSRLGYYFTRGPNGLGYYLDGGSNGNDSQTSVSKRKREEELIEEAKKPSIDALLQQTDQVDVVTLDATSLKPLLANLDRKVARNLEQRTKYLETPEKFVESELELNAVINDLFAIAASPELYPMFVELGGLDRILGLLSHENSDISLSTVGLLLEMVDVNIISEVAEAMVFVNSLLDKQGLELLVQNLNRFDSSNEDDALGIHNTLGIIESLNELRPDVVATELCSRTKILEFLMKLLKNECFDENKLYSSEILSILLQADASNQLRFMENDGNLDLLLRLIAPYRKQTSLSADEEEYVHNLFLSLSSLLMERKNQDIFRNYEGLELMLRFLKDQKPSAFDCVRIISYAVSNNRDSCQKLVEIGGLKYLSPILLGKGLPKPASKTVSKSMLLREAEEQAVTTFGQLCFQLYDCAESDCSGRLLLKFLEKEREKLDRCVELFAEYSQRLGETEMNIRKTIAMLNEAGDETTLEEYVDDDNLYAERLDGGLFLLQQVTVIIGFVCLNDPGSIPAVTRKLRASDLNLSDLCDVVDDFIGKLSKLEIIEDQGKINNASREKRLLLSVKEELMKN